MSYDSQHTLKYIEAFSDFKNRLNGETKQPYFKVRKKAIDYFEAHGFPTTREEDWRFTNISPIVKSDFIPIDKGDDVVLKPQDIDRLMPDKWDGHKLVFIDGFFSGKYSRLLKTAEKSIITNLAKALETGKAGSITDIAHLADYSRDGFTALNTAFMRDGAYIHVPDDTILEQPVLLFFLSTNRKKAHVSYPRNLIFVGRNSKIDIVEFYTSLDQNTYLTNCVSEVHLSDNAYASFDKIQNDSLQGYHISTTVVNQSRDSRFRSVGATFGGKLVRNNIEVKLNSEGIETTLNGLYLGHGQQHIDNFTHIDHANAHCSSNELFRGILGDKAKGVFSGKITVRPDAQKTDAKQTNNCLLLSDDAKIDSKPQLEIYADDVRCTHGATVGELDEESLFYLRARGISEEKSKNILTYAFVEEVIQSITLDAARQRVEKYMEKRLEEDMNFVK